ncbi:MAG: DUF3108 domain-containing protein [Pseudomonadota bacterium]
MSVRNLILAAGLLLSFSTPGSGGGSEGVFDVYIFGLKAGTLSFSGIEGNGQYSTAGRLQSGGLVGAVANARYEAQSRGRLRGGAWTPEYFEEDVNTGKKEMQARMAYVNGVPQVKQYEPAEKPKPHDLDPSTQGDTVDPMTAIYRVLRDQPADEVCTNKFFTFDGRRRTRVALRKPTRDGERVICEGRYVRVGGFPPKDMAEQRVFPITVEYVPMGGGMMRVDRLTYRTGYGDALLRRR